MAGGTVSVQRRRRIANRVISTLGIGRLIPTVAHLETAIRSVTAASPQEEASIGKEGNSRRGGGVHGLVRHGDVRQR